ncbi:hypothetical protein FRB99_004809, partial [Tulasnella sp. 403]
MWQHLLEQPLRAENVQTLKINDYVAERTPRIAQPACANANALHVQETCVEVLKRMRDLKYVEWRRRSLDPADLWINPDVFWTALKRYCPNVISLTCSGNFECGNCSQEGGSAFTPSKLFDIEGLKSYSQNFLCVDAWRHLYDSTHVSGMISRCAELQSLHLRSRDASSVIDARPLWQCRFPKLQYLSLMAVMPGPDLNSAMTFFSAHPSITRLRLLDVWAPDLLSKALGTTDSNL